MSFGGYTGPDLHFTGAGISAPVHQGDCGYDLAVESAMVGAECGWWIAPGTFRDLPLGCAVQLPTDCWGLLTGRSSTLRRMGLLVNQGIIDQGYRGPLFVGVWNMTDRHVYVPAGARIAQLILMPLVVRELVKVEALDGSGRGTQGFGSTGV